jgi:hypothetical protein
MSSGLPDFAVPTPKFLSELVPLPYQSSILLDPQTNTRWLLENNNLTRDHKGECEWEEMARYINKEYYDVFMESYRFALESKQKQNA